MRSIERGTVLLNKYRVDSIIGRGGMALVVKARHLGLDEQVAIKLLRDDVAIADDMIARFVREAQAAVRLKGEHVARIIDVGTFTDGRPYMVMEYLEGQDVGQLLAERGWLSPSLAIELMIQACEALAEAHSLGIVHRDIKPSNLFLTSRPDGSVLLKVLDFGISKAPSGAELSLTQTWSLLGTPAYMSPEQMRSARDVDVRTDIWSLGAVLYEVLEGHLPFQAESFSEMCVMVAVDPPTPTAETPRELVPIISRCLAKSPDDRYPNVAELARDLARLAREPDKAQITVDRIYRIGRARRRTPAVGVPQLATGQLPVATALPPRGRAAHPAAKPATPVPILYSDETPHTGYRSPFGELPNGFAPAALAAGTPRALEPLAAAVAAQPFAADMPRSAAPTGVAQPHLPPRPPEATPAAGLPASPIEAPPYAAHVHRPPYPRGIPPQIGRQLAYPLPLPSPLTGDARYLRPGLALPRGAASDLTRTHVITRPVRGWLVALVTTAIAVVTALAVIAASERADPPPAVDDVPEVVRMKATAAPVVSPIAEPAAPTTEAGAAPTAPEAPSAGPARDR